MKEAVIDGITIGIDVGVTVDVGEGGITVEDGEGRMVDIVGAIEVTCDDREF